MSQLVHNLLILRKKLSSQIGGNTLNEPLAIYLRIIQDTHTIVVIHSCDCLTRSPECRLVLFTRTVVAKCLIYVATGSQFYLANTSCYKMIATELRGFSVKFVTGKRHQR